MKNKAHSVTPVARWTLAKLLFALPVALVCLCAGCKPDAQTGGAAVNPVGTYTLVSVDGKNVPCTIQHDGHSIPVHGGAFTINPDNTCSSKMEFTAPDGAKASRDVKATYTQKGPTLTMSWEGAGMTEGSVKGNTFTMNNEGMVLTYRK